MKIDTHLARSLDKFYTSQEVARSCVDDFCSWTGIDIHNTLQGIIEPSAGSGSFLEALPSSTKAYDIHPEKPGIIRRNFFEIHAKKDSIVIGNPPFGRCSNLAVKFFNHSALFASHIAFIVPRTFQKDSIQAKLNENFHLLNERVLPEDSFTLSGKRYSVPCVFQVWKKESTKRQKEKKPLMHKDFFFVEKGQASFAVQRVGSRAGALKNGVDTISPNSHYFIKENRNLDDIISIFKSINFDEVKQRTAGNPSISKTEVVELYEIACSTRIY